MAPYIIHAGKSVHIVKTANTPLMEEGEQYAVETFGSIMGEGYVRGSGDCSHYMRVPDAPKVPLRNDNARKLLAVINKNFGTLAFSRKWLENFFPNHGAYLNMLVQAGLVRDYPPLVDKPGSLTAQYEHTILLRPTCKEVITRGDDFWYKIIVLNVLVNI